MTRFRLSVIAIVSLYVLAGTISAGDSLSRIRICTELFPRGASRPPTVKGTGKLACYWHRKTLTVRFLEGDPVVKTKVEQYAHEWTRYSGITFVFNDAPDANIRIRFNPDSGSWSYIGQCQEGLTLTDATMNFGWLTRTTDDVEYRRVVLHEFGHALGLLHEHQNPTAHIPWNASAVYDYYRRTQGWDQTKTTANVLSRYETTETNYTAWDRSSIMEYAIPKELTLGGFEIGWNSELSEEDKRFIHQQYGS
jgi:hypothetical protein